MHKHPEIWMDSDDLGASMAPPEAPQGKKTPKAPSQSKLSAMLMHACASGDRSKAIDLLGMGAPINARARTGDGATAFDTACMSGHADLALDLLERGGFPGVYRRDAARGDAFDKAAICGFSKQEREAKLKDSVGKVFHCFSNWRQVERACQIWGAAADEAACVERCASTNRFDLALDRQKNGNPMPASFWNKLFEDTHFVRYGLNSVERLAVFSELCSYKESLERMQPVHVAALFHMAMRSGPSLLHALLEVGVKPPGWLIGEEEAMSWSKSKYEPERSCSLLASSAARETPEMFNKLLGYPGAKKACCGHAHHPEDLAAIPISRLMQLFDMGMDLSGVDGDGNGLAHYWASTDIKNANWRSVKARDGWATLARRCPEIFDHKNKKGLTGADEMLAAFRDEDEKQKFRASLSKIEIREIKKTAPVKKAPASPKPSFRL